MKEILRLIGVNYRYEDIYPALIDVCVTINEGERIAVLGGNGAGKSTFFLCCNGVLRPQSGKLFLRGQEITYSKRDLLKLRQTVGLVFQEPDNQIIAGSVESEVSFGPMNLYLKQDEVIMHVTSALKQMNLDGYEDRAPQYLSGGEKKRVTIADILAMKPDIMLLDEPTASLDPENVDMLERTLDELCKSGITTVVSTHDVDFAYRFADRGIVFSGGAVIADDSIDKIFASKTVLSQAGLQKPLLYEATELIEKRFNKNISKQRPKNIDEFGDYIRDI